ncbi:MAG: HAD family hydrolase [Methanolinea sp.]|nr:HAD family hydrolase [Methanolinea sp.]
MSGPLGKNPIQAIVFDMDNTLFDLVRAKYAACQMITKEAGCGRPPDLFAYFLRNSKGFEDPRNIRDFLLDQGVYSDELFDRCSQLYRDVKLANIRPYPGVCETLATLGRKGLALAVVTDAHRRDAIPRLRKTGLLTLFDHVVTYDVTGERKPSPLPFLHVLEMLQLDPPSVMMVGDSPRRDIVPSRQIGMVTVYARYGDRFSRKGDRGGAHYAVDSVREILSILERKEKSAETGEYPCAAGSPSP